MKKPAASALARDYDRLRTAAAGHRMPAAFVDIDAFDRNVDAIASIARRAGKPLRIATKSIRSLALIERILLRAGSVCRGLMSYSVAEAGLLVDHGHRDVLVAYPSVQDGDATELARLNDAGAQVSIVVDSREHVAAAAQAARRFGTATPLVIELDMSIHWRTVHLGVKRSHLRDPKSVAELAELIERTEGVRFLGVMGYEAQVAGVGDSSPYAPWLNPVKRAIKVASRPVVRKRRREVTAELAARGIELELFNGGGTGSIHGSAQDAALTEITAGSGFLCSHLFDYYRGLELEPAAFFGLQVTRLPGPGVVTCQSGGFVASGEAGADRLPRPFLPEGLTLTKIEGAGEVQTPLAGAAASSLSIGDPVFFRHAKAGELAEHFNRYVLVSGNSVTGEVPTYRGLGHAFH